MVVLQKLLKIRKLLGKEFGYAATTKISAQILQHLSGVLENSL